MAERFLPVDAPSFVLADDSLDFDRLLDEFIAFWRQHAESFLKRQPYSEAAAQLICMAYLQRVVNGGGYIDREYAAGSEIHQATAHQSRPVSKGAPFF